MSTDIRAELLGAIRNGQADLFLDDLSEAIKARRDALGRQLLRTLRAGVRVVTTPPLRDGYVGFRGTVQQVNQTRVAIVLDKGQYSNSQRINRDIELGVPITVPASCIRVLDDQTPPTPSAPPRRTTLPDGAVVESVPFDFDSPPRRRRR